MMICWSIYTPRRMAALSQPPFAFRNLSALWNLQVMTLFALYCVLHRSPSRDIHRWVCPLPAFSFSFQGTFQSFFVFYHGLFSSSTPTHTPPRPTLTRSQISHTKDLSRGEGGGRGDLRGWKTKKPKQKMMVKAVSVD